MMMRVMARKVANYICKQLENDDLVFEQLLPNDYELFYIIKPIKCKITIEPRRFRIFDKIVVMLNEEDVWFPLWQRLRIRRAFRKYLLQEMLLSIDNQKIMCYN